jgi:hypothetical protein
LGAREDLLEAASRLTDRGQAPFSPADLIAEARSAGSNYPDTTLRTFIVGPMCVNSPDNHAVQYGDLFRVERGLYRLAVDAEKGSVPVAERPAAAPRAAAVVEEPHEAWSWEGNVQAAIVRHLAAESWNIRRVADTVSRERGVDVEADRDGKRLLVEVKGYPSTTYASGQRAGETKRTSPPLQARAYFSHALLAGILMRDDHDDARVALAFPAIETYVTLAERTASTLAAAGIEVWLVAESGEVSAVDPS